MKTTQTKKNINWKRIWISQFDPDFSGICLEEGDKYLSKHVENYFLDTERPSLYRVFQSYSAYGLKKIQREWYRAVKEWIESL